MNLSELQNLNRQVGWPEDQIVKSSAIGIYESGGNPNAVNDGSRTGTNEYSVGLYQINTLAHHGYTIEQLKDPFLNSSIALQLWRARPNYADWYNSNLKYQRDYQGVATRAYQVYSQGSITNQGNAGSQGNLGNYYLDNQEEDDTGLYILLGLAALFIFSR